MQGDINIPKTKSVNIFLQFIKLFGYILVSIFVVQSITSNQKEVCSDSGQRLIELNVIGSVVMILLNLMSMIFIWLKEPFARLEFFVMYAINLSWSAVTVANTYLDILNEPNECQGVIMFQKATIFLTIKVHLEVILTFIVPLPFPFRISFLPTSLLPLYILLTSIYDQQSCGSAMMNIEFALIFVNFVVICLGVPLAFFLLCSKSSKANNAYKFLIILSAIGQLGVISKMIVNKGLMVVAWIHKMIPQTSDCVPSMFAVQSYFVICPFAVVTSLFMLLSLKTNEADNIRANLLKEREKQIQQQEYSDTIQKHSNIYVKPMSPTVSVMRDRQVKDNISVSYGTISKKG